MSTAPQYRVHRYVHLGFNPTGSSKEFRNLPHAAIEAHLNVVALDWYRYASQNYVVFTNAHLAELVTGIRSIPGLEHVYSFATEFHPSGANGIMTRKFWDWLNKPR